MKQKTSRGLCRKIQKSGSEWKRICQSTLSVMIQIKNTREADGRDPPIRFEISNEGVGARRRSRAAVVAGGDPRRGREIGEYLCVQGAIPRLWEVVVVTGEYHVGGDTCSGGRLFGWSWISPERAARSKLRWGLSY